MKNSLKYLKLWQKKRDELQLNDDPQQDWLKMQGMLDTHMPVKNIGGGKGKLPHITHFKLISTLLVAVSTATIVYFAVHKKYTPKPHYRKNKVSNHNGIDSTTDASSTVQYVDSLKAINNKGIEKDSAAGGVLSKIDKPQMSSTKKTDSANNFPNKEINNSTASGANVKAGSAYDAKENLVANGNPSGNKLPNTSVSANNKNVGNLVSSHKGNNLGSISTFLNKKAGLNHVNNHHDNKLSNSSSASENVNTMLTTFNNSFRRDDFIQPVSPVSSFLISLYKPFLSSSSSIENKINLAAKNDRLQKDKKGKNAKSGNSVSSSAGFEWGVLTGVNTSGSFTPKNQNPNFYGSLPADVFLGLFATYPINEKWGISTQIKFFTPQKISGSYTHTNGSSVDSNQTLKIADSRKLYSVEVPVNVVYKVNNKLSLKAGPVFDFPVKQANGVTTLTPTGIKADSAYYANVTSEIKQTKYDQKLNIGFSAGISVLVNRLVFEANYLKGISSHKVSSSFGSYNTNNNTLQFTIGFKLNGAKKKK